MRLESTDDPAQDLGEWLDIVVERLAEYVDHSELPHFYVRVPQYLVETNSESELDVAIAWLPELLGDSGVISDFLVSYSPYSHLIKLERIT